MAKKERNSGLGRGLDSLIPNIAEEKEVRRRNIIRRPDERLRRDGRG